MDGAAYPSVVVVGLGYVGLPLAVALARDFPTVGLDVDKGRIAELSDGHDRTGEIDAPRLRRSSLVYKDDPAQCPPADVYIVTVPTPVDAYNRPDLRPLIAASETVGTMLDGRRKPLVIFESTVYPGITEGPCAEALQRTSGLRWREHFHLGYSPERINPGDREHTVDRIMKVVAGDCPETTDRIAAVYERVTTGGIYRAASIKAAEGAKAIENAQRDINIAFMNEVAQIFARMDLSIWDVLDAAKTKWNFLPFHPGLVGGHCIGVDPYYLTYQAQQTGYLPDVILAGRMINDGMGAWMADALHDRLGGKQASILVLGLTFKENVPDMRNSKVVDMIRALENHDHQVTIHDPLAESRDAAAHGITLDPDAFTRRYDLVIVAVAHQLYRELDQATLTGLVAEDGLFADITGVFRGRMPEARRCWTL